MGTKFESVFLRFLMSYIYIEIIFQIESTDSRYMKWQHGKPNIITSNFHRVTLRINTRTEPCWLLIHRWNFARVKYWILSCIRDICRAQYRLAQEVNVCVTTTYVTDIMPADRTIKSWKACASRLFLGEFQRDIRFVRAGLYELSPNVGTPEACAVRFHQLCSVLWLLLTPRLWVRDNRRQ